jgi:hypothetical protein
MQSPGADPGFQVKGVALKKIAPSGGKREIFGVFRVKYHDFTPKNHIFSNFRGGARRVRPPLDPPLVIIDNIWNLELVFVSNGDFVPCHIS